MIENLIVLEHDGQRVKRSSLGAITLARQFEGDCALVVLGRDVGAIAASVQGLGAAKIIIADHAALAEPLADRYAAVIAEVARRHSVRTILGTASTFTKDVLPRVAALLDAAMASDVTAANLKDGVWCYQRLLNAGSLAATVTLDGDVRVLTVRGTAFAPPSNNGATSSIESFDFDPAHLPDGTQFISRETHSATRPELTEARVVVSGGRPLNDKETFDRLIGGLADALGGAVGATRAAVDAGMVPNDYQVGQTGKVVAPELYIAVGVSGSIQHMAGVQESKVIVAINRDPDAAVFQLADYGLVGDLHEIVPRLIAAVRA